MQFDQSKIVGSGIYFGSGGAKGKFIQKLTAFLKGELKVKPSQALQWLAKALDISATIASKSDKYKKFESALRDYSSNISNTSSALAQAGKGKRGEKIIFGSGKPKTIMIGGKRHRIKDAVNNIIEFFEGKKRIKPQGLLKAASVVVGVIGVGVTAVAALGGPASAAAGAAFTAASTGLWKAGDAAEKAGSGRHLSGHGIDMSGGYLYPGGILGKSRTSKSDVDKAWKTCKDRLTREGYNPRDARRKCRDAASRAVKSLEQYNPEDPKTSIMGSGKKKKPQVNILALPGAEARALNCLFKTGDPVKCSKQKYKEVTEGRGLKPGGGGLNPGGGGCGKPKCKGTKEEVWCGAAKKTGGGLTKKDLMKNPKGKIVSIKKYNIGKQRIKNLKK